MYYYPNTWRNRPHAHDENCFCFNLLCQCSRMLSACFLNILKQFGELYEVSGSRSPAQGLLRPAVLPPYLLLPFILLRGILRAPGLPSSARAQYYEFFLGRLLCSSVSVAGIRPAVNCSTFPASAPLSNGGGNVNWVSSILRSGGNLLRI